MPTLLQEILSVFAADSILTPPELASRYHNHWPSMEQLMADGKRLVVVSLTDYGDEMAGLVFPRGLPVCRWLEPELVRLVNGQHRVPSVLRPTHRVVCLLLTLSHQHRLTCRWHLPARCCTQRAAAWSPCTLGACSAP